MFRAKVAQICQNSDVCCVEFSCTHGAFFMVGLELLPNLRVGSDVMLSFRSSDVIISQDELKSCSIANKFPSSIVSVEIDQILCLLKLKSGEFEFESIISALSAKRLNLKPNDQVYAYIKATSLWIAKIYD